MLDCSEIFVVRRSLFVLDVRLLRPVDAAVGQLWGENLVATIAHLVRAAPVPVHSADELEASDLLISKVSDNLQHFSTISIETEDLEVQETGSVDAILQEQGANSQASNKPLRILSVLPKNPFHLI